MDMGIELVWVCNIGIDGEICDPFEWSVGVNETLAQILNLFACRLWVPLPSVVPSFVQNILSIIKAPRSLCLDCDKRDPTVQCL